MKRLSLFCFFAILALGCALLPVSVRADSGHARIIRLSLVQGDVRYTREFHKDSLDDGKAVWEPAALNLPIREGFALSTNGGARAEVEFESGAMAFLSGNSVLEFYDLSLDGGALITRLILRQGSAIFYVNPAKFDFFSVTGGDFSIEAKTRTRFRLDNYDDGSTASVEQGQVDLVRNEQTKPLEKGQSYTVNVSDAQNPVVARSPEYDDFDKWVSGRIDSVVTATTYAEQYVSSPSYSSGFADLYNYGGWYSVPGYGYGWQPFGVALGWDPFAFGNWNYDSFFGLNFISGAPWGWLPYHYGGWIFNPVMGWLWVPSGFGVGGGPLPYRPVTAVWVRSGGTVGIVPLNPLDGHGKTPLNINQGVYPVRSNAIAQATVPTAGEKWTVMNHASRDALPVAAVAPASAPTKVSRTILSGNSGSRAVTLSRDSSIVYDPAHREFVNNGDPSRASAEQTKAAATSEEATSEPAAKAATATAPAAAPRPKEAPPVSRAAVSRPNIAPPEPPNSGHNSHSAPSWVEPESTTPGSSASSAHSSTSSTAGSHAPAHH
jgi:hypothetical protein